MNVEIANKLVLLRKKMALSQEELAEKIGVSRQAVSKWERAESSPDTDNLIALSKIYNISLDDMLDPNSKASADADELNNNYNDINNKTDRSKFLRDFPISILIVLIYMSMGVFFGLWHPGWIIFLAIPLFHFFIPHTRKDDDEKKVSSWKIFPYPILVVIIFIILGFLFDGWSYAWLIFLTIPIWGYFMGKK